MTDFSFCNPVRVEFGKDKEKHIGQYMKEAGAKKALVLYGSERVRKSGLMGVVESSLKANGIEFAQLGVGQAEFDPRCTFETQELFSYRRDGVTGRFCGFIMNKPMPMKRKN